jgi:hypothetical protein
MPYQRAFTVVIPMRIRHSVSIAVLILSTQAFVMPRKAVAQNNSAVAWFYCSTIYVNDLNWYVSEVFSANTGSENEQAAHFQSYISQTYGFPETTLNTGCATDSGESSVREKRSEEMTEETSHPGNVHTVVETGWVPPGWVRPRSVPPDTAKKPDKEDKKKTGCDDPPNFTSSVEVEDGGTAADQAYAGTSYCMAYVSSRSTYPLECHLRGRNMTLFPGHEKDLFEGWPLADGEKCEAHIVCTKEKRFPMLLKRYCP